MTLDFNQTIQYRWWKQETGIAVSGHLRDSSIIWLIQLLNAIIDECKGKEEEEREKYGGLIGCLHHLNAFLLQAERFGDHVRALYALPSRRTVPEYPLVSIKEEESSGDWLHPPAMVRIYVERIEYDFLQLLLSGTATLERLATYVSTETLEDETNFYNLRSKLAVAADPRATYLREILDDFQSDIAGVLVADAAQGMKSLRNRIAHLSSIPELTQRAMTVHLLEDGRILRFDHMILGFPMIRTAHRVIPALAGLVAETCGAMFGLDSAGIGKQGSERWLSPPLNEFQLLWTNRTANYDDFIDPTDSGPRVSIFRPIPGGFQTYTRHLMQDVLDAAEPHCVD